MAVCNLLAFQNSVLRSPTYYSALPKLSATPETSRVVDSYSNFSSSSSFLTQVKSLVGYWWSAELPTIEASPLWQPFVSLKFLCVLSQTSSLKQPCSGGVLILMGWSTWSDIWATSSHMEVLANSGFLSQMILSQGLFIPSPGWLTSCWFANCFSEHREQRQNKERGRLLQIGSW